MERLRAVSSRVKAWKAVCPSQELWSRPKSIISTPAFTHLSRSHSQRFETFETLFQVSLHHIRLSNAQFVLILCFCPQSQSILLYPEAETMNPSKELEAAHFRLQSSSSMRRVQPLHTNRATPVPHRQSEGIPFNLSPAPGTGKIVKDNPNTCPGWSLLRNMLHTELFCC